ncbi:MAG: DUF937 domain-containing protein [Comamonadaceae bacterium]|nr:DUF937 domain-containing protein [Pseudomonadota bacterium]MBS0611444.1 DUF937 domain-containing protein [Pseudomonadota bacterium]MDE2414438.1 DUF937 domain-containing protein [Comamonadaceae bacterium]
MDTPESSPLLAEQLLQHLQGPSLQHIAQQLGTDQAQAQSAVEMALPVLLGALGRNAQDAQGADALFGALQRDHMPAAPQQALGMGGMDLGGLLGSMLGGAAPSGAAAGGDAGAAILGHIFGGGRERVESSLGQAAGVGANAGQLLQMLAPVVMSFLAHRVSAGGMDSGGLGHMLGQERAQSAGTPGGDLLGGLLDRDGDGQVGLGDLVKIGASLLGGRR